MARMAVVCPSAPGSISPTQTLAQGGTSPPSPPAWILLRNYFPNPPAPDAILGLRWGRGELSWFLPSTGPGDTSLCFLLPCHRREQFLWPAQPWAREISPVSDSLVTGPPGLFEQV